MNGCCKALVCIASFGLAIISLYMYHFANMSLFVVNLEKCRDKPVCDLEAVVSGWGAFIFALQLVFLILTILLTGFALMICLEKRLSLNNVATTATKSTSNANETATISAKVGNTEANETTETKVDVGANPTDVQLETIELKTQPGYIKQREQTNDTARYTHSPTNPFIDSVKLDEMI